MSRCMYSVRSLERALAWFAGERLGDGSGEDPHRDHVLAELDWPGVAFALLGSWVFSVREFRVKTPEGS